MIWRPLESEGKVLYISLYLWGKASLHPLRDKQAPPKQSRGTGSKVLRRKILAQYEEELSITATPKTEFPVTVAFQSETKALCVRDAVGILIPNKGSNKRPQAFLSKLKLQEHFFLCGTWLSRSLPK